MQINVSGSGGAAKKDLGLPLSRFLRHPVKKALNHFAFDFQA
jgi:hypothetical protein